MIERAELNISVLSKEIKNTVKIKSRNLNFYEVKMGEYIPQG